MIYRDLREPISTDLSVEPSDELDFHDVLKNSYASKDQQEKAFKNKGYEYDKDLSNDNEQVYYNSGKKKLLYSIAGTHNLSDIGTDAYLAFGNLKGTNRYKEAEEVLRKAKDKYKPNETSIGAHSLGGAIGQYVAGKDDKVFTLDKGSTILQPTRDNEKSYRTKGDLVSVLSSQNKNTTTFSNPNFFSNFWNAHDVDNIKNKHIII